MNAACFLCFALFFILAAYANLFRSFLTNMLLKHVKYGARLKIRQDNLRNRHLATETSHMRYVTDT